MFDTNSEEFAPLHWNRFGMSGAVSTIRRARRQQPTLRDMLAFVGALVVIGVALEAHFRGIW